MEKTKYSNSEGEANDRTAFHSLYNSMIEGVAFHKIIYDKTGNPIDYAIVDVNPSFEKITGLSRDNVIDKKATEIYGTDKPPYFDIYTQVASTGNSISFDSFFAPMNKHFLISVFSTEKGMFTTVFQDVTELKQIESAQDFLLKCGMPTTGEDFFRSLSRYLAEKLRMDYVCIDRLTEEGLEAQTLAIYSDGSFEDNFTYTLKDTPCADVVKNKTCFFPNGVRALYPNDAVLQKMKAESYVGNILWSSDGNPIGLIAAISRKPLTGSTMAESIIKTASLRAAGELERRISEEKIKTSELRYRRLFESAKDGILILDYETGMIVDVNPFLIARLGYSYEEFTKKHIWDIGIFKDVFSSKDAFIELKKNSYIRYEDLPLNMRDGKKMDVEFVSNVYLVNSKKVIQCNIRDITERKKVEKELQETTENLEALINYANAPIIVWDSQFNIIKFNNAFESLTGRCKDEVIGKNLNVLFQDEEIIKHIKNTAKGERLESAEIPVLDVDGLERIILWNSANIYDREGKITSTIAQGQDITGRKKAEKEISKSLVEKELLLEEVNHRVKNNLQLITSLLHLQQLKSNKETALMLIDSQNRIKSISLVHEILYGSKDFTHINVNSYIRELVKRTLNAFSEKRISVNFDIDDIPLKINTAISCGLIVNELMTNVMKHAFPNNEGTVAITLKTRNNMIELVVTDNGVGLPDDFVLENTKSLGLKLVKSLSEQLEGNMDYKVKDGTVFKITFPNC